MARDGVDDCIFCKIINKEIYADFIYEDDEVSAFIDINPFSLGHVMVVPKEHTRWIWDMKEEKYVSFMKKVKYVAGILKKAFDTDCIQIIVAGMDVPHTHLHLLPRTKDDGLPNMPKEPMPKPSDEEFKEIAEKIRSSL